MLLASALWLSPVMAFTSTSIGGAAATHSRRLRPAICMNTINTWYRRKSPMLIEFGAQLKVNTVLAGVNPDHLSAYLAEPRNVIEASWPADRIKDLGPSTFRLVQDQLRFAVVDVNNSVDVEVTCSASRVDLESTNIESMVTIGNEKQRADVSLKLDGHVEVRPAKPSTNSQLVGAVQFSTQGKLIGPLLFLPDGPLELATGIVNRAILDYASKEFSAGIRSGFLRWWTLERQAAFNQQQQEEDQKAQS